MDRRSFFLTALLPVVAAKRGVLGLPGTPLRELCKDRLMIMTLKARNMGMSRLVHAMNLHYNMRIDNGH